MITWPVRNRRLEVEIISLPLSRTFRCIPAISYILQITAALTHRQAPQAPVGQNRPAVTGIHYVFHSCQRRYYMG